MALLGTNVLLPVIHVVLIFSNSICLLPAYPYLFGTCLSRVSLWLFTVVHVHWNGFLSSERQMPAASANALVLLIVYSAVVHVRHLVMFYSISNFSRRSGDFIQAQMQDTQGSPEPSACPMHARTSTHIMHMWGLPMSLHRQCCNRRDRGMRTLRTMATSACWLVVVWERREAVLPGTHCSAGCLLPAVTVLTEPPELSGEYRVWFISALIAASQGNVPQILNVSLPKLPSHLWQPHLLDISNLTNFLKQLICLEWSGMVWSIWDV